jgi:hypothetical protein
MKKLLKKLLAPLIREVVAEELKKLNQQVENVLLSTVSNVVKSVKVEKIAPDSSD